MSAAQLLEFERAKENWISAKIKQQNKVYTAISQFNDGLITYSECQSIAFNCFQRITGEFVEEFKQEKFF